MIFLEQNFAGQITGTVGLPSQQCQSSEELKVINLEKLVKIYVAICEMFLSQRCLSCGQTITRAFSK